VRRTRQGHGPGRGPAGHAIGNHRCAGKGKERQAGVPHLPRTHAWNAGGTVDGTEAKSLREELAAGTVSSPGARLHGHKGKHFERKLRKEMRREERPDRPG